MTDSAARLPVVLLWHMHQPQYRDALTGQYVLPWTYLHAIKDYTDMAAHLEAQSGRARRGQFHAGADRAARGAVPSASPDTCATAIRCRIRCWGCSDPARAAGTRTSASRCCRRACARSASR